MEEGGRVGNGVVEGGEDGRILFGGRGKEFLEGF